MLSLERVVERRANALKRLDFDQSGDRAPRAGRTSENRMNIIVDIRDESIIMAGTREHLAGKAPSERLHDNAITSPI